MIDKLLNMLPDLFKKSKESNIAKLLSIFNDEIEGLKSNIEQVDSWREIDKAEGKALDLIGEQYGEFRGKANDEFYRYLIKSKIVQRNVDGSTNKIIEIINQTLGVPLNQIKVVKLRDGPSDLSDIQAISIEGLPEKYFLATDVSEKFIERIHNAVAAGISLERIFFDSENNKLIYISAGFVSTESITITHDVVLSDQIILPIISASADITTSINEWSLDAKTTAEIEVNNNKKTASVSFETVVIK